MATYTSNYNLYMPDPTDPVGDFRSEFNSNMQTIDQNLGGGGGHTIVNPSGSDMPAESKLQFTGGVTVTDDAVNGKTVVDISGGGGGDTYNVYGAFIDTANVVHSRTGFHGSDTYTATEDCFVSYELACPTNDNAYVEIDGVAVCTYYYPSVYWVSDTIPLKTGQTISFSNAYSGYSSFYTVYGITQGVNQVGHHYSTSEQVIGTWHDGRPLYEKTIIFDTGVVASNIDYDITSEMPANCEVVNDSFVMTYTYGGYDYRNVNSLGAYHQDDASHYFNFNIGSAQYNKHVELTIQYTKTTD